MPQELYHELIGRLSRLRERRESVALWSGIATGLATVVIVVLAAVVLEAFGHFSIAGRTWLFYSALLLATVGLLGFAVPPILIRLGLRSHDSDDTLAMEVGNYFPIVSDRLVNSLQLARPLFAESGTYYGSPSFALAALGNVHGSVAEVNFLDIVEDRPLKRSVLLLILALAVAIGSFAGARSDLTAAANRLEHFRTFYQVPAPFTFIVFPGDARVMRGDTVPIRIYTTGEQLSTMVLQSREEGQKTFDAVTLMAAPFDSAFVAAHHVREGFTYLLQAQHPMEYYAMARTIESAHYTVSVLDHPMIRSLIVEVAEPAYTRIKPVTLPENIGDISGVTGTRGIFQVVASKPLAQADVIFTPADTATDTANRAAKKPIRKSYALSIQDSIASGSVVFMQSGTYHVSLLDRDSVASEHPIEYTVTITPDQPPEIVLIQPDGEADLPSDMRLDMLARIHDDYGFRGVRLGYRLSKSKYHKPDSTYTWLTVPLAEYNTTDLDVPYIWNLTPLSIGPEDEVSYVLEVTDNDAVTGPHSVRTPEYIVRVPSVEEIFKRADEQANKSEQDMKEIQQDAEDLQKKVDAAADQLKQLTPQELAHESQDFSKRQDVQQMIQRQNDLSNRIDQVSKDLQQMTHSMQEQNALSPETLKKYDELQDLFKQINSPELQKAMERLQEAMQKNADPEKLAQAMQNMKVNEEQFRQAIQRTENILRKIQAEQRVDELRKSADELAKEEQKSADNARHKLDNGHLMSPEEKAAEQRKQGDAQKELDRMRDEMKSVAEEMKKLPQSMQPTDQMKNAAMALADPSIDQAMQQSAQSMQEDQMQQGAEQAQSASQKMSNAEQKLAELERQLSENERQRTMREMREIQDALNRISKGEEQLKNQAQEAQPNSNVFRKMADQQSEKKDELGQTASQAMQLAQKSTEITPEMGRDMGQAFADMQNAEQSMTDRNQPSSEQNAESAMTSLNKASSAFQKALQQLAQNGQQGSSGAGGQGQEGMSGSGSGMDQGNTPGPGGPGSALQQFINQINQMTAQQQSLNDQMQQMMAGKGGGGEAREQQLMRQEAAMHRMEAQQQAVKKSLQQLADEQSKAQTGLHQSADELRKIADEMQQSIGDMKSNGITPETIQRQERILARLLQAQESVHERDKDPERESKPGVDVVRPSPRAIDIASPEVQKELQQEILNNKETGFTPDYNALVRKYFESLEQK